MPLISATSNALECDRAIARFWVWLAGESILLENFPFLKVKKMFHFLNLYFCIFLLRFKNFYK
jgi:hypothetical protein